jgi:Cytidine deaminase
MEELPDNLTEDKVEELVDEFERVRENAFATTADITVGAAILTDSNKIYAAPYFESVIEGLGTCAERNAVGSAVAEGEYKFKAVVVT